MRYNGRKPLTLSLQCTKSKPYTAITVQINRLTSEQYEADDMSGIPDLIEVIRIQTGGPTEAARAIRKKLKYGNVDQQLRALTILDSLIENAGSRFQRAFADEPLLERLRVCATDSLSDPEVKKKCQILFRQWAVAYKSTPGMERIVALQKQLPKRKKPVTQQQSRVLKETEPSPNEDPFSNAEDEEERPAQSLSSPRRSSFASASNTMTSANLISTSKIAKKAKSDKNTKTQKHKGFNLEREKPQILQAIASSSMASTNLANALKLIDREHKRVSEDPETVNRFETCKQLRRQILRYIQHIESEQWLGSLIHANDGLVEALMAFEILDKSVEDDSDSEGVAWSDDETPPIKAARSKPENDMNNGFAGLSIRKKPLQGHPTIMLNGKGGIKRDDDSGKESEEGEDDPFADSNAVHTPKGERPGMTWREA
ncbi:MAG: hypothetical protein Q9217_001050 [Psora testacea]